MAVKFAVPIALSLVDSMTPNMAKAAHGVNKFAVGARAAFRSIVPEASRLNDVIKSVALGNLLSTGITKVAGLIKSNIGSAINYASDMIEVQNVVNTVFGNSTAAINEFAKSATDSFGLTELQAKKFSSTIGAVFGGMGIQGDALTDMSTRIAGLAGDLASFYNLDIDTAFNKLKSGITGQSEPLKQLGIIMSQANLEAFAMSKGMKTAWKDMNQAAQTTLRYQFILEKTALAQGDYAKPIDSWAVSSRNLSNSVGEMMGKLAAGLIPGLIQAADYITGIVRRVSEWADANRELIAIKVKGFIEGAITWIKRLIPLLKTGYKFIKEWGPAVLAAYAAFKTFQTASTILDGVSVALKSYQKAQELAGFATAATKTAAQAATVAQWQLNAAAAAFPVAIIAGAAIAMWKLADSAAKAYNQVNAAVPGSKGYNNMNPRAQRKLWADYNAKRFRNADWRPTDEDPQEFERNARGMFVLKQEGPDATYGESGMSEWEKQTLKKQEEMDEWLKRIAANTEPEDGPAKSLNYSLAGIGDIWSIVRQGI
ncbi:MAG: hypothetical protein LBK08_10335 [Treponema sp.]|jgi:hypothetical protein|nr:hypothetical protein [Treponema sp.]